MPSWGIPKKDLPPVPASDETVELMVYMLKDQLANKVEKGGQSIEGKVEFPDRIAFSKGNYKSLHSSMTDISGVTDVTQTRSKDKGQITIKAKNWRDILKLAVASGAIPESMSGTLEDALGLIAGLAGNPKTLDIPLDFRNGRMLLGPVPIGPAPVLVIR